MNLRGIAGGGGSSSTSITKYNASVGSGGQYATVQAAITAGKNIIAVVGAASETSDVTIPVNTTIDVFSGVNWNVGDNQILFGFDNSILRMSTSGGVITWSPSTSKSFIDGNNMSNPEFFRGDFKINMAGATANDCHLYNSITIVASYGTTEMFMPAQHNCGIYLDHTIIVLESAKIVFYGSSTSTYGCYINNASSPSSQLGDLTFDGQFSSTNPVISTVAGIIGNIIYHDNGSIVPIIVSVGGVVNGGENYSTGPITVNVSADSTQINNFNTYGANVNVGSFNNVVLKNVTCGSVLNSINSTIFLNVNQNPDEISTIKLGSSSSSTTTNFLNITSSSTGAFSNGAVRLNLTGAHTGNGLEIDDATVTGTALSVSGSGIYTGTTGIVNFNNNSATTGIIAKISGTGITDGKCLSVTGGGANTTSSSQMTYLDMGAATNGNGLYINNTGVYIGNGISYINAPSATTGTISTIFGSGLTSGRGLNIVGGGSSMTASGIVENINMLSATVGSGLTIMNSGVYTGTGISNISADSLTTGTASTISTAGLTSGKSFSIAGGGANMTSSGVLEDIQMGSATNGSGLNITTTGVYAGNGIFNVTGNSATTGTLSSISATGLTTGVAINVVGGGTNLQSGGIISQVDMGSATAGKGLNVVNSGAYTGGGVFNVKANSATTGTLVSLTCTGLTTGKGISLTGGGSTMTSAAVLDDIVMGAATNGSGLNITTTGVYVGSGMVNAVANSATSGTIVTISATGMTTGRGLAITGGGANMIANSVVEDIQMGAAIAGNGLNVTTTGAYTGTGVFNVIGNSATTGALSNISGNALTTGSLQNLLCSSVYTGTGLKTLVANSATTGTLSSISGTGITTGNGLTITGGGANMAAGGALIIGNMGAATAGNGINLSTTGVYTGTGLLTLTANNATTGTVESISCNALTTGTGLSITSSSASINSTNGLLYVANTSSTTTGLIATLKANSTSGSGINVYGTGQVFIGRLTGAGFSTLNVVGSGTGSGTSAGSYVHYIENTDTGANSSCLFLKNGAAVPGNNNQWVEFVDGSGSERGSIEGLAGAVNYFTTSDRRLKTNIVDTHYTLADLMLIKAVDYNPKDYMEYDSCGFIAQDLYDIYPQAVSRGDENEEISEVWKVEYSKLTPLLVKSIQDLSNKVDEMQAQINTLLGL